MARLAFAMAVLAAVTVACTPDPPARRESPEQAFDTLSAVSQQIVTRVHVDGLIFDPEVADSARALALRRRRARTPAERAQLEAAFLRWLGDWTEGNPARSERAKLHAERLPGFAGAVDPRTGTPAAVGKTPR
jgi:hypothetical protein